MRDVTFQLPTRVIFGSGRIRELGRSLPGGGARVLLVTDRGVAAHTTTMSAVRDQLRAHRVTVVDDIEPNPSFATVERAGALARQSGTDLVIGLGGGSPMDAAKGIAILATNDEPLVEIMDGGEPSQQPLPVVCIPTTSGTGSEVTPFAVFSDIEGHAKRGYASASITPVVAVIDPELTYSMPPNVIVDTGLDVLTHAVEAFVSLEAEPFSDLVAQEAAAIVCDWLPAAVDRSPEAMQRMAWAATLAGMAIAHAGTTLLHVMGYPLTAFHGVPHGRANAAMLPDYLSFLARSNTDPGRLEALDRVFSRVHGVRRFIEGLGVSTTISDYGVTRDQIAVFVDRVIHKDDVRITPALVGREEISSIYEACMSSDQAFGSPPTE